MHSENQKTTLPRLERLKLSGTRESWLSSLRGCSDAAVAANMAWSAGLRISAHVPVSLATDDVIALLRENQPQSLSEEVFVEIARRLRRVTDGRHRRALSYVSLPASAARGHRVEHHQELPRLAPSDYRGVILVSAPMGVGKTREIGRPFADWAQAQTDTRFLAVVHRVSLVDELSRRLSCPSYQTIAVGDVATAPGLATCLQSIVRDAHAALIRNAGYLFLDEGSQLFRALAAGANVADRKTAADVFWMLGDLIRSARCIIVADATLDQRVVELLEFFRPGEQFRCIVVKPKQTGFKVNMGHGEDALVTAYGEALARLAAGERLWISCCERRRAIEVGRVLEASGKRVLVLHGGNKECAAQAAFWRDPEAVSREYDAVVHTSVISSGVSIEHAAGGRWFDHGMLIAAGAKQSPADALQMMRRVRYLTSWTVATLPNNIHDLRDPEATMEGMREAAMLEGLRAECSSYDHYATRLARDEDGARCDFSAGLWWGLQQHGFDVERMQTVADADRAAELKTLRAEIRAEERAAILSAPALTAAEAAQLRRTGANTDSQVAALTKFRAMNDLGVTQLDGEALDAWDDGRGPVRIDRFSAAVHGVAGRSDDAVTGHDLAVRRFERARVLAYQTLFRGIELGPGMRIDDALAHEIVERVTANRYLYAYLGIVPATPWARYVDESNGDVFKAPERVHGVVNAILARMGLGTVRRRICQMSAADQSCGEVQINHRTGKTRTKRAHVGTVTWYEIEAASWEQMLALAASRNAKRVLASIGAPARTRPAMPSDRAGIELPPLHVAALAHEVMPSAPRVPTA